MKLNNFMFKEEYAYTYKEVLELLLSTPPFISKSELVHILDTLGYLTIAGEVLIGNKAGYSFIDDDEEYWANAISEKTTILLNKIYLRYKDHYAIVTSSEDGAEVKEACCDFFVKVCNVLDYTYDKYVTLLDIYEDQKNHLLDKLHRVREEDKTHSDAENHYIRKGTNVSSSSQNHSDTASSDTPQTINNQEGQLLNGYWNEVSYGNDNGSSSSEGSETDDGSSSRSGSENIDTTESYEPTTIMARIDEIQTQYENTMFKWVEEFDRLFIEEGNI